MIELNPFGTNCVKRLTTYRMKRRVRRHVTLRLLSLMLSVKLREVQDALNRFTISEAERQRMRPSVLGKEEKKNTTIQEYQQETADLLLMVLGFLRWSGVKDVDKLLQQRLDEIPEIDVNDK
jgi:hypothetical protein